jgi:PilZ domain
MTTVEMAAGQDCAPALKECRVFERFPSEAPVLCQPPSCRGRDLQWAAHIRNISAGGLCLVLRRWFKPGAALAVELPPTADGAGPTVYVQVVHVQAEPGDCWSLGCKFVSGLSECELVALGHPPVTEATPEDPGREQEVVSLVGVRFRAVMPGGWQRVIVVKRLVHVGRWPLEPGRVVRLRDDGGGGGRSGILQLRIDASCQDNGCWTVDCTVVGTTPAGQ